MITSLLYYEWTIFIVAEILSSAVLLLFGVTRYIFHKRQLSILILIAFIGINALEALLVWALYQQTGEVDTFQIIVIIFLLYACTFGFKDFKRLDKALQKRTRKWRKSRQFSEDEIRMINKQQCPTYSARQSITIWSIHVGTFIMVQAVVWVNGGHALRELLSYTADLLWNGTETPYVDEMTSKITGIWIAILMIDTIWTWFYVIFPPKKKSEENNE